MPLRTITAIFISSAVAAFLIASCGVTMTPVGPTPQETLETAVRATIASQVSEGLASGLARYEVLSSELLSEGQFGRVEARIVLDACPLFAYDLPYNGELKSGQWILYNDAETLPNLFKSWATARSAALGGESVKVPGVAVERQITLIPEAVPELLQARLDGLSNPTVDPLVGFFVCEEQNIRWDELDPAVADTLRQLVPQVRQSMESDLATE